MISGKHSVNIIRFCPIKVAEPRDFIVIEVSVPSQECERCHVRLCLLWVSISSLLPLFYDWILDCFDSVVLFYFSFY